MKIAVIDGQGGGLGSAIIQKMRENLSSEDEILALGTNAMATAQMMKAGATRGATGENAFILNAPRVDVIVGPLGILLANAMLGEITPKMAEAVATSPARKVVLPITTCRVEIAGFDEKISVPALITQLAARVRALRAK